VPTFEHRSVLPFPPEEVFTWHGRPLALERLTPPWERFRIDRRVGGIQDGGEVWIRQKFGPFWFRWHSRHSGYVENRQFYDEAVEGPFTKWQHSHTFETDPTGTRLQDRIEYGFPGGRLGEVILGGTVGRSLQRAFRYRHATTREDLVRHLAFRGMTPLRVLISGASGFLGSNLTAFLSTGGHEVHHLVRRPAGGAREVQWDPALRRLDPSAVEGFDAVIHLSGGSLERGRWTASRKRALLESRTGSTRFLAETLSRLDEPPRTLLSVSAVGFYGHRGDDVVTETVQSGTGFLAEVCREWEAAADPARSAGIRVLHPRLGVVLSPAAGYLRRLLPFFRMGFGMCFGTGRQWVSWVALDDVLYALHALLMTENLQGPVNVTSPTPVRNTDLARTLGEVLRRPAGLPAPGVLVGLGLGEKGREALLKSTRALPAKLTAIGHRFSYPGLEHALRHGLGLQTPAGKAL